MDFSLLELCSMWQRLCHSGGIQLEQISSDFFSQWVSLCISIQCEIPNERHALIQSALVLWFTRHLVLIFTGVWVHENPQIHIFPADQHSPHFCSYSASTWIIHLIRKKGWAMGKPLKLMRVVTVGREVRKGGEIFWLYVTTRFHGNVVRPVWGAYLIEP